MRKTVILLLLLFLAGLAGCSLQLGDAVREPQEEGSLFSMDQIPSGKERDDGSLALIQDENGLWGYLAKDGQIKIPCRFSEAAPFSEGLAPVREPDGLFGYITVNGEYAPYLHPAFTEASCFSEGAAAVRLNDSDYFYINHSGELFFQERILDYGPDFWEPFLNTFLFATEFRNGCAVAAEQSPQGETDYFLLSPRGDIVMELEAEWCENEMHPAAGYLPDENGYIIIGEQSGESVLYGVIDLQKKTVLPAEYEEVLPYSDGLFAARKNGLWGYVNEKNETVLDFQYPRAGSFVDGSAPAEIGGSWGLIGKDGVKKTVFLYEDASEKGFCEGLLRIKYQGKWGFLDTEGNFRVVPALYAAGDFSCGVAVYETEDGKQGVINAAGEIVIPAEYGKICDFRRDG